jgi:hypothetical protein
MMGTHEVSDDYDLATCCDQASNSLVDHEVEVVLEDQSLVVPLGGTVT